MKILLFFLILFFQTSTSFAFTTVITAGDLASEMLARILIDDTVILQKPGSDGLIAFNELEKNKNSFMIATSTSLYLAPNVSESYKGYKPLENFKIISLLASTPIVVVTPKSGAMNIKNLINKENYSMGGFGSNSICKHMSRLFEKFTQTKVLYIPYTTVNQINIDVIGSHIDSACSTANIIDQEAANGDVNVVVNLGSKEISEIPFMNDWPYPIDIHFVLIGNKNNNLDLMPELNRNLNKLEKNKNFNQFKLSITPTAESVKIIQEQFDFWKKIVNQ